MNRLNLTLDSLAKSRMPAQRDDAIAKELPKPVPVAVLPEALTMALAVQKRETCV